MKLFINILSFAFISIINASDGYAQNYLAAKKETVTFVIDLSSAKVNSNIKNDLSAFHGIELSRYCERPDLKQALMILNIDRTIHSDNNPIGFFLENAGVSAKPVSDNSTNQLQQLFCQ